MVETTVKTSGVVASTYREDFWHDDEDSGEERWIMGILSAIEEHDDVTLEPGQELILLDSGSAEHVCPEHWHSEIAARDKAASLRSVAPVMRRSISRKMARTW